MAVDPGSCEGLPVSSGSDSAGFALLEPCASSDACGLHEPQTPTERADPSQASPCFGELMALGSCDSLPDKSQSMPLLDILKRRPRFHVMDASLRLARHHSRHKPWDRQVRPRLGASFMFQEPLLGRFDYAVGVTPPIEDEVPWGWVPKGTYEARRLMAARFAKSDDEQRVLALKKIRTLVLIFPEDSELGRSLISTAGALVEESMLTAILEDTF